MAKKKTTKALAKAVDANTKKAEAAEQKRQADVDARWRLYARALLAEPITQEEEDSLPAVLDSLGIDAERVNADLASIEKVRRYEAVLAQKPVASLADLRAQRDRAAEEYERLRRLVNTTTSYQTRKLDMETRVAAIRHSRPSLWKHLDALLPLAEPGVEPQPRERDRIIALFSQRRASSPVAAPDNGDPEPIEMVETVEVEHEPVVDPALAAAAAGITTHDPGNEAAPVWPRPIAPRRFKRG